MLGSPILYLKGMRILMFQLSGFYYMVLMHLKVNEQCFGCWGLVFRVLLPGPRGFKGLRGPNAVLMQYSS